jgi:general secretion pathway protein J
MTEFACHGDVKATRQSISCQGFTLIEVLVVISLLSIIMAAMVSSLRTVAQTESRIDERLRRSDQIRVVNYFLKQTLGRVVVVKNSQAPDQKPALQFEAIAASVSWVGIMPARHGAGGRYFFRLATEESEHGNTLILRYAPWLEMGAFPDWTQAESQTIIKDITEFRIEAEGLPIDIQATPADWPRGWQSGWPLRDALPQRLRLTLVDQKGAWPPLLVNLIPTIQSLPGSGGFVAGGSTR